MKSEEAADNITVVSCPLIGRMIAGYEPGRYHFLTKLRRGVDYSRRKAPYVLYPHFTRYFDVFLCFPGVDFVSSITINGFYMLHSHRVGGFEWQDSIALISLCIWHSMVLQASNMRKSQSDDRETMLHDCCVFSN